MTKKERKEKGFKMSMLIRCKKSGKEFEITDNEVGVKIKCPCCGERLLVDDSVLPSDVYTATLIRKTEVIALEPDTIRFNDLFERGTDEYEYEQLFNRAYEERNADAQFELAMRIDDTENQPELVRFWVAQAANGGNAEAQYWMAEWHWQRGEFDLAERWYRDAAKLGHEEAKEMVDKFQFNEWKPWVKCGGRIIYEKVLEKVGRDNKYEEYLCSKYGSSDVELLWMDETDYKGTLFVIGSFADEKEVPRELLSEISGFIGRRLAYWGRLVDERIAGATKFLFFYAVLPSSDDPGEEEEKEVHQNHISELLQDERDAEYGELARLRVTWREAIEMNCPLCETKLKLPTRLTGGQVRCPHCKGEFVAKGEGIMTTSERRADRLRRKFDDESVEIDHIIYGEEARGSVISSLRLAFGAKCCETHGQAIGSGMTRPWPGIYVDVAFKEGVAVDTNRIVAIRELLSGALGFWMRQTNAFQGYEYVVEYYIRQDRPCKQNENVKLEVELKKEKDAARVKTKDQAVHVDGAVKSREMEEARLEYLIFGNGERSRNRFDFQEYLRKKYGITRVLVSNNRPGDIWSEWHGLKDGFGVVVVTQTDYSQDVLFRLVQDMEKRFSRKLTLGKKHVDSSYIEYGFIPSMPNKGVVSQSKQMRSALQGRNATVRSQSISIPQHIGKGTGVDWSLENKVFSQMLARHGIKKFNVEMANPYCAEISIPMTVDADVVRKFANDLFHALDVLDADYEIDFGQPTDCSVLDLDEETRCYYVVFNHHAVKECESGDAMYKYKIEAVVARYDDHGVSCSTKNNTAKAHEASLSNMSQHKSKRMTNAQIDDCVKAIFGKNGMAYKVMKCCDNKYVYEVFVSAANETKCVDACNELFRRLGVLSSSCRIGVNQYSDYCGIARQGNVFMAIFNTPEAFDFKPNDANYRYLVKSMVKGI